MCFSAGASFAAIISVVIYRMVTVSKDTESTKVSI
jgi:hypothetical protein